MILTIFAGGMTNGQYDKAVEGIFSLFPSYQVVGDRAFKPGLENMTAFDEALDRVSRRFPSVHIAGTNGKGSTSHFTAAALASNGLKVGLYTSPHLVDFRERIKICNAGGYRMISKEFTFDFLTRWSGFFKDRALSFFEITTGLAFAWFAYEGVDVAVIETGMGGRLDSTNIITPQLSVITNIGYDHCRYLGDTLAEIAYEKAGIIKPGVPVVIGESCEETEPVFRRTAQERSCRITFADRAAAVESLDGYDLRGDYQKVNLRTVKAVLSNLSTQGYSLDGEKTAYGLRNAARLTGLFGRWQLLQSAPDVICDTGHNAHGLKYVTRQLSAEMSSRKGVLRCVIGVVAERDLESVVGLWPEGAVFYFTNAGGTRAMPAERLAEFFRSRGLSGSVWNSVEQACRAALADASEDDLVFVGASSYVVAEALPIFGAGRQNDQMKEQYG